MNININKDFEKHYRDDTWRGFTLIEVICMLGFLFILFGIVFFLWKWMKCPPDLAVYVSVPFGLPILCVGFFKYQGMTILELVKEVCFEYQTRLLIFDADEVPDSQIFTLESVDSQGIRRKKWERLHQREKGA